MNLKSFASWLILLLSPLSLPSVCAAGLVVDPPGLHSSMGVEVDTPTTEAFSTLGIASNPIHVSHKAVLLASYSAADYDNLDISYSSWRDAQRRYDLSHRSYGRPTDIGATGPERLTINISGINRAHRLWND